MPDPFGGLAGLLDGALGAAGGLFTGAMGPPPQQALEQLRQAQLENALGLQNVAQQLQLAQLHGAMGQQRALQQQLAQLHQAQLQNLLAAGGRVAGVVPRPTWSRPRAAFLRESVRERHARFLREAWAEVHRIAPADLTD